MGAVPTGPRVIRVRWDELRVGDLARVIDWAELDLRTVRIRELDEVAAVVDGDGQSVYLRSELIPFDEYEVWGARGDRRRPRRTGPLRPPPGAGGQAQPDDLIQSVPGLASSRLQ